MSKREDAQAWTEFLQLEEQYSNTNRMLAEHSPETHEQLYAIRLPDGTHVQMDATTLAKYEGDWSINLTPGQAETLYNDIMRDD